MKLNWINHRSKKPAKAFHWDKRVKLGSGDLCDVYKCIYGETKKNVAIKIVRHQTLSDEEKNKIASAYTFAQELKHENINAVIGLTILDANEALVMELADQGNLKDFKFKDEKQKIKAALDIIAALRFLHEEKGTFHRNLKPTNILFRTGASGEVVAQIGDAGFGKVFSKKNIIFFLI